MSRTIKVLFIGIGKTHRHAALMCLDLSSAPSSGKEKTMKTPKTPIDFDYDLWTTEDGRCMVRVKITGEVTEVSREIMRLLRAEEKRIRRDRMSKSSYSDAQYKSVLYLDDMPEEDDVKDTWLADKSDFTDDIMAAFLKEEFISTLTTRQKEVFDECIISGVTLSDYAKTHGVSVARVSKIIADIQKKAKNFFA